MTETLSVRIDSVTKRRLDALARRSKRSKSFLAAEAITAYVEMEEWQMGEILAGIEEFNQQREKCRMRNAECGIIEGLVERLAGEGAIGDQAG